MQQVNECGRRAVAHYPGMVYWDYNWRKQGGSSRMIEISKREKLLSAGILWLCVFSARYQSTPQISGTPSYQMQLHYERREGVILWITFLIDFILAR